jgi:hypothetical protein
MRLPSSFAVVVEAREELQVATIRRTEQLGHHAQFVQGLFDGSELLAQEGGQPLGMVPDLVPQLLGEAGEVEDPDATPVKLARERLPVGDVGQRPPMMSMRSKQDSIPRMSLAWSSVSIGTGTPTVQVPHHFVAGRTSGASGQETPPMDPCSPGGGAAISRGRRGGEQPRCEAQGWGRRQWAAPRLRPPPSILQPPLFGTGSSGLGEPELSLSSLHREVLSPTVKIPVYTRISVGLLAPGCALKHLHSLKTLARRRHFR